MAEVVSIRGEPIAPAGVPVEEVVALAREILERAEAGAIRGLTICIAHSDDTFQGRCAGAISSYGMLGVAANQFHMLNVKCAEDD